MANKPTDCWVIPNDRELELRARIGTGWSVHTNALGRRNVGISDEEKTIILQVVQRAEALDRMDQERVGVLVEKLDYLKDRARGNGKSECILCGDHFKILSGAPAVCIECKKAVCSKCCSSVLLPPRKHVSYICKICNTQKELWKKSGAWFYNELPNYVPSALSQGSSRESLPKKYNSNLSLTSGDSSLFKPTAAGGYHSSPQSLSSSSRRDWGGPGLDSSDEDIPLTKFKTKTFVSSADSVDTGGLSARGSPAPSRFLPVQHSLPAPEPSISPPSSPLPVASITLPRTAAVRKHGSPNMQSSRSAASPSLNSSHASISQSSATESSKEYDPEGHSDYSSKDKAGSRLNTKGSPLTISTPSLYHSEDMSADVTTATTGTLDFSLLYDDAKSQLEVHLVSAKLQARTSAGTMDPFAQLNLLPSVGKVNKKRSQIKKKSCNPLWNELFIYYGVTPEELSAKVLRFSIKNSDGLLSSSSLGELTVPLDQLQPSTLKHYYNTTLQVKQRSREKKPEKLVPTEGTYGRIELSLHYSPIKELLTIGIIQCSDLPAMDANGYSDPYVKMYLKPDASRETKKKTSIKKKTLNPVFNEVFKYHVSSVELRKKSLHVSVWDYDGFARNDYIGTVLLSIRADKAAGEHWRKVMNEPGTKVTMWHRLSNI